MDIRQYFDSEFDEHAAVLSATRDVLGESFERLVAVCIAVLKVGSKLMFFGNGGSAADVPDR
jgi:D-sedoheptulose 7-phosphate isomerase